jgi:CheY-like chemotaxis protein
MSDHGLILIVDDSEDDVFLIKQAFKKACVPSPLKIVCDGEEAVAYLSGQGSYENRDEYPLPELILLDLKMPRMDGFQVLQWIRQQSEFVGIPVLVLTSSEQVWEINMAYTLGANSFLEKPGDFENFKALAQIISRYWLRLVRLPESVRPPQRIRRGGPAP